MICPPIDLCKTCFLHINTALQRSTPRLVHHSRFVRFLRCDTKKQYFSFSYSIVAVVGVVLDETRPVKFPGALIKPSHVQAIIVPPLLSSPMWLTVWWEFLRVVGYGGAPVQGGKQQKHMVTRRSILLSHGSLNPYHEKVLSLLHPAGTCSYLVAGDGCPSSTAFTTSSMPLALDLILISNDNGKDQKKNTRGSNHTQVCWSSASNAV